MKWNHLQFLRVKMDNVSKRKRSDTMSRIKSQDSKIEIKFRKQLWAAGFRYRKNSSKYLGKPDLVLPTAVPRKRQRTLR